MRLIATIFVFFAFVVAAVADQSTLGSPTTGTVSGLQLTTNYNAAINAINTCNSGTTAPTNQVNPSAGTASAGNCWLNTNTAPTTLEIYDGTTWVPHAYLDTVSHLFMPIAGSNIGTVASASTTNLCSSPVNTATAGASELISGTTTINSFGSNCQLGAVETVEFLGALTLTNSTSLVLPTGANITTAAGDWATFIYLGSGNWATVSYLKANGGPLSSTGISVGASGLANTAFGYQDTINLGLTATVASNNLTMCMVANDTGVAPTATDPIILNFRSSTIGNGQFSTVKVTSSNCFTINSGNTMGATSTVPFRLWVVALNNGGTPLIGAYMASTTTQCQKLNEGILITTGAGANGGSAAFTVQTSVSAVTGAQLKILGYLEFASGLGTAGTWNATPTYIQLFGQGVKSPCDNVANYYATSTGAVSQTVTPTSSVDLFKVMCTTTQTTNTNAQVGIQVKRGATLVGAASIAQGNTLAVNPTTFVLDAPVTTTGFNYTCNVTTTAGSLTESNEIITVDEIMGALEPANENEPLRMTG